MLVLAQEFAAADGHGFDTERVTSALGPLLEGDRFGEVWVAAGEDQLDGYAVVTWGYSIETGGQDALLDEVYARHRGSGIGSALLEQVIDSARARSMTLLFLETERYNEAARRLYRRYGFVDEESVWMSLDLT